MRVPEVIGNMGSRLERKSAMITGSARGLGREMAKLFASEGAAVAIRDVDAKGANAVAAEIAAAGGRSIAIAADITDPNQVDAAVRKVLDAFGRLDILVNNAGIGTNEPVLTTTLEEWDRVLRVNLTGTFLCAQAAGRIMVRQGAGSIVNIASISGQRGGQGRGAYGASKAGVILLTQVMAVELGANGVRVNAVSPGPVDTEQSRGTHTQATRQSYLDRIPLRRYGQPGEIAAAVLFLASDESSFINGHILNNDGGFMAAGLMFDPQKE